VTKGAEQVIALAADEIVMDSNAVLGPVDPQLGEFSRPSS
jgi:ClpP class serine protease